MAEIPDNKVKPDASKAGDAGIVDDNASHERQAETVLQGAVQESFITKAMNKLKMEYPDWADDKIKSVAMGAAQKAFKDPADGKGNEENEGVIQPASDMAGAKS